MENSGDTARPGCGDTALRLLATFFLLGLLALVLLIVSYMQDSLMDRLRLLLGIVGYYTIALGLISDARLLRNKPGMVEDMTSPRALEFVRGNFVFLGVIAAAWASTLGSRKTRLVPGLIAIISRILLLTLLPWLLLYALFHILIILPLAYVGFLMSTAVIENLVAAPEEQRVAGDPVRVKAFVVGIPSAILSMMAWTASFFAAFQ